MLVCRQGHKERERYPAGRGRRCCILLLAGTRLLHHNLTMLGFCVRTGSEGATHRCFIERPTHTHITRKAVFFNASCRDWACLAHRDTSVGKRIPHRRGLQKQQACSFQRKRDFSHDAAVLVSECDPVVSSISILVFKTKTKTNRRACPFMIYMTLACNTSAF